MLDGVLSDGVLVWASGLSATYARLIDDVYETEMLEAFFRDARGIPFTDGERSFYSRRRTALYRRQSLVEDFLAAYRRGVDRALLVSMARQVDAVYRREFPAYKLLSSERLATLSLVA